MKSQLFGGEILIFLEFNMLNLHIFLREIHVPMVFLWFSYGKLVNSP